MSGNLNNPFSMGQIEADLFMTDGKRDIPEKNQLDYTCGISDEEMTARFKAAIRLEMEKSHIMNLPVARYDDVNKKAYLGYRDGRKEYVC